MKFIYMEHAARMREAVETVGAAEPDGRLNREYAATLYLLTGMEFTWPRLKKYTGRRSIDCEAMIENLRLSRGEELIVALAGNLFNGRTYSSFQPIDLIDRLDNNMLELAINGIALRRSDTTLAELA